MTTVDVEGLRNQFFSALNQQDEARLREIGRQLAEHADIDFPIFHATLNVLGFHSQLALINDMMRAAWSQVQSEPSYSRPAVQAYAARAADHLIYAYLQQPPRSQRERDALVQRLEYYFPVDHERLQTIIQLLSGHVGRKWSGADFEQLKMPALHGLMVEFLGFASRADVPYARAHLVRDLLPRYFMDRQAGNLQPKPDMAEAWRQGRRPFPPAPLEPPHPLVPDRNSLGLFLKRALQTVQPQPYATAAILLLMPVWLAFIDARNLASQDVTRQSMADLFNLRKELAPYWADHPDRLLRIAI